MIASHYAEPVQRLVKSAEPLRAAPDEESETIGELTAGDTFDMLDCSVGWAWGYAGDKRRVGYVRAGAVED